MTRSPAARLGACAPLELAQQREAALGTAARGAREKARLGVELGERSGRELFDQLVDAHVARLGERLEPLLRRVGHADGKGSHGFTPSQVLRGSRHVRPPQEVDSIYAISWQTGAQDAVLSGNRGLSLISASAR